MSFIEDNDLELDAMRDNPPRLSPFKKANTCFGERVARKGFARAVEQKRESMPYRCLQVIVEMQRVGISFRILDRKIGHIRIWEEWDIWPSTGSWHNIKTQQRGKGGLKELLNQL